MDESMYFTFLKLRDQLGDQLTAKFRHQLGDQLTAKFRHQLGD